MDVIANYAKKDVTFESVKQSSEEILSLCTTNLPLLKTILENIDYTKFILNHEMTLGFAKNAINNHINQIFPKQKLNPDQIDLVEAGKRTIVQYYLDSLLKLEISETLRGSDVRIYIVFAKFIKYSPAQKLTLWIEVLQKKEFDFAPISSTHTDFLEEIRTSPLLRDDKQFFTLLIQKMTSDDQTAFQQEIKLLRLAMPQEEFSAMQLACIANKEKVINDKMIKKLAELYDIDLEAYRSQNLFSRHHSPKSILIPSKPPMLSFEEEVRRHSLLKH